MRFLVLVSIWRGQKSLIGSHTEYNQTRIEQLDHIFNWIGKELLAKPILICPSSPDAGGAGCSNFIGVAEAPFTYESPHPSSALARPSSPVSRHQTHDKGQTLLRLLVGKGRGIQEVRRLIGQVAETDANVLILGESGTGRRWWLAPSTSCPPEARALRAHQLRRHSWRSCSRASCSVGRGLHRCHCRRRGRFELAQGGTLFLDEIGDMPLPMQVSCCGCCKAPVRPGRGGKPSRPMCG